MEGFHAEERQVEVRHPNREKAESKATRLACLVVLLASAALITIITLGGWSKLEGAQIVAIAYVLIYLAIAWAVVNWSRGVLPLTAALSVIFTTFAVVAAPAWFARDKDGLADPALPPELLGLLTLILIGAQILLIVVTMRGFQQQWNVEVEVHDGPVDDRPRDDRTSVAGGWA